MNETWWKLSNRRLTQIEVAGSTNEFVKLSNGRRMAKSTEWYDLFATREEAIDHAKVVAAREIAALEGRIKIEREALAAFLASEEETP